MKIFEKTPIFVISYLIAMGPTYVLPWLGSNSSALQGLAAATRDLGGDTANSLFLFHLACLIFMIVITWVKGKSKNQSWIAIFPVVAAVFDVLPGLSLIPLIPTFMHVLAIIYGARGQLEVVVVEKAGG